MTTAPESPNTLYDTMFVGGGEMAALMRSHNWSTTPLGPVETWPPTLRTSVSNMLAFRFPQVIFWGEDYIQLYNDSMIPTYGAHHPKGLGQPLRETWAEIWDQVQSICEGVKTTGEAFFAEDQPYHVLRFDYWEETYFTLCYSPLRDETGKINGISCTSTETTQQVIRQRRLTMLRELATAGSGAKTLQSACLVAADALNPYDIPFALFYQVNAQGNFAELLATSGLTPGSAAAPLTISLIPQANTNHSTDRWSLAEVLQSREPLLITDVVDRFEVLSGGPWPENPNSAFILPIFSSNKEHIECVLIVGISPRLQFDVEYRSFLELVARQVESSIITARSYEAERRRGEVLVELDRAKTIFFNNVSHEFRTPLTLILSPLEDALKSVDEWMSGSVDEWMNGSVDEGMSEGVDETTPTHLPIHPSTLKEPLQLAYRNSLRLLKLVNTLLDFSRIESDRAYAIYAPTDLAAFTTELASVFRSAIERANLHFVVDCPPLPEPIYVDREMWERIVFNLVSNAFKFTFTGEIRVSLRWGCGEQGSGGAREQGSRGAGEQGSRGAGEQGSRGAGEQGRHDRSSAPLPPCFPAPHVILEVSDTGIGIPALEIPRLFERFHRVKGAQGRTFEGSGIGLSLVQELVKLHGGTIQVSSVEGKGSCFQVMIPAGSAHLPQNQIETHQTLTSTAVGAASYLEEALRWLPEQSSDTQLPVVDTRAQSSDTRVQGSDTHARSTDTHARSTDTHARGLRTHAPSLDTRAQGSDTRARGSASSFNVQAPSPRTARVLLVDDNADMRDYLRRLLSERWQVTTAANGAIALNLIQKQLPDLVLTDVMMPEMDGFQLLSALRADPITQSIPVILLSARAGEEATVEGLEAGADDYLIKPFSARELVVRVETQLQMSRLRQELSANRFKNEFLMTVTHELQSPLATVLGWARFLQTKSLDPDAMARALATIERNATIEAKLIKNLLDVASILSGKLRLKSQVVDLASLVRNVTATFRAAAQAKRIQLVEKVSKKLRGDIFADGDRLKQVIANLLENAIKFTPEGGQVTIRLEHLKSHIQITVSDTGIGIRPDFLPYVFDRFSQAEVPSRYTPGGVGLGLAIARHLIELHHGTIGVTSEGEGRGATFTVRLPLNHSAQPNEDA